MIVCQPASSKASICAANCSGFTTSPASDAPTSLSGAIRWYMKTGILIANPAGRMLEATRVEDPGRELAVAPTGGVGNGQSSPVVEEGPELRAKRPARRSRVVPPASPLDLAATRVPGPPV